MSILALVAAVVASWPAAATPLEDAMAACRRNADLDRKVAACTFVIERSHDSRTLMRAYNTRGLALCDLDRCAEAVSDFDHVVAIEPSIAGYFDNRARALRAANRLPEAIADSERAMRMAPTYAFTYMGKAYTLDKGGRYDEALATADQALAVDPSNSGNWEFRGKVLAKLRRWSEAYAAFDRALSLDPSDVSVWKARAEAEEAQGRLDDALRDYERYPTSGDAHEEVARGMQALREKIRARDAAPRDDLEKKVTRLDAEKQAALDRAIEAERKGATEAKRADDERLRADAEKSRADEAQKRADDERRRADTEKGRADLERRRADAAEKRLADRNDAPAAPKPDRPNDRDEADRLNASVADLEGQIVALRDVLRDLKRPDATSASAGDAQTVNVTVTLVSKQLAERQAELDEKQKRLDRYLETHKDERDRLAKVPRSGRAYPRVSYSSPTTRATGELWVEPTLGQSDKLLYQIRVLSASTSPEPARDAIAMTPSELADVQAALTKIRIWSLKAAGEGVRGSYSKRAACFPQTDCPDEGSAFEGRPYTELRFIIRDDGSTVARLQRSTGQAIVGYDLSTDSALLMSAYVSYAKTIAGREFRRWHKQDLDKLFQ